MLHNCIIHKLPIPHPPCSQSLFTPCSHSLFTFTVHTMFTLAVHTMFIITVHIHCSHHVHIRCSHSLFTFTVHTTFTFAVLPGPVGLDPQLRLPYAFITQRVSYMYTLCHPHTYHAILHSCSSRPWALTLNCGYHMHRVGQNHINTVYTVFLANMRSYTVIYIYRSGQPYLCIYHATAPRMNT